VVVFHWGKTKAFAGNVAKFRLPSVLEGPASRVPERR
jgi:hypothetical protein